MAENKPRRRQAPEPRHPLLGAAPTLQLMRTNTMGKEVVHRQPHGLLGLLGLGRPDGAIPQRLEPKTFLASERTFLSWMHMAVTLGSIGAALLAFAAGSKKSKSPMHTVRRGGEGRAGGHCCGASGRRPPIGRYRCPAACSFLSRSPAAAPACARSAPTWWKSSR